MSKRSLMAVVLALPAIPALAYVLGGWAIVTVDDLPEYLVAGRPTAISFTVRQHGMRPLDGLQPSIEVNGSGEKVVIKDLRGEGAGRYTTQLTVPTAGQWTVAIRNGFGPAQSVLRRGPDITRSELLPLQAIAPGAKAPAPAAVAQRGAALFVAKGCIGCHVHGGVELPSAFRTGPELTGRRYPSDYLAKLLANPAAVRGASTAMPNLGLHESEIGALVAFINAPPPARK